MPSELEFWPEYGRGPLWRAGTAVDLASVGLDPGLQERLRSWNADYDDARLPSDGQAGDLEWLDIGRSLLLEVRKALAGAYEVHVHEPWWGEPDVPFRQPRP